MIMRKFVVARPSLAVVRPTCLASRHRGFSRKGLDGPEESSVRVEAPNHPTSMYERLDVVG